MPYVGFGPAQGVEMPVRCDLFNTLAELKPSSTFYYSSQESAARLNYQIHLDEFFKLLISCYPVVHTEREA